MAFVHCSSCRRFFSGWSPVATKMVTDHVLLSPGSVSSDIEPSGVSAPTTRCGWTPRK